jgi:hypothetical protein
MISISVFATNVSSKKLMAAKREQQKATSNG